jgi:nitrate reductase NapE component
MNNDFDRMQRQSSSIFRFAFGAWFVWLFVAIAFWGGVGYVAWHFLSKFW